MAGNITRIEASEAVYVVLVCEPQPGKMGEVEAMVREGVKVHEANSSCKLWHISKTVEKDGGEGSLVVTQAWTDMSSLQEHGQSEESQKTKAAMGPLLVKPPTMHISKTLVGFKRD